MKPFEFILAHPVYFSTSRRGIGGGLWIGLFIGLIPVPAHTLLSVIGAVLLRVNVPVAVLATWITNPFTFVPIYYFGYQVGAALLNVPPDVIPGSFSFDWVLAEVDKHWKPLLLGTGIVALSVASTVYFLISVVWHIMTVRRYRSRHQRTVGSIKGGKRPALKQSD